MWIQHGVVANLLGIGRLVDKEDHSGSLAGNSSGLTGFSGSLASMLYALPLATALSLVCTDFVWASFVCTTR
jgi:hypothetical protein